MMNIFGAEYLRCLIGVSLLVGLILVIRKMWGKRLSKRMIYGMWMMIPVYMVLVHFVSIPMPHFMNGIIPAGLVEQVNEAERYIESEQATEVQITNGDLRSEKEENMNKATIPRDNTAETTAKRINPVAVIRSIYGVGIFLFVGTILYINIIFAMRCKRKRIYFCNSSVCKLAVYRLEGISSPFLMGKNIYVPADMENGEELHYAILHEECHHKHGDALWVVLRYLILGFYFYNPIMWLAFKYSGYDCELACDEAVMANLQEKEIKKYGGCLLNAIERNKGMQARVLLSTNLKSNKKLIRERIENIVTKRKKSYMAMLLSVAMLFTITGCFLMDTRQVNAEEVVETITDSVERNLQLTEPLHKKETVSEYSIPASKDYQLKPYKITEFEDGYLFGFGEQITDEYSKIHTDVSTSSTLAPQGKFSYESDNLLVPSRDCIWSEGVDGYGIGEWVELRHLYEGEEDLYINEICIVNGYAENETKWTKNSRVKILKLYYEDEYVGMIHLKDVLYPQYIDVRELQMYVPVGKETPLRFEIAEVYEGSEYEDTCITGIEISFGKRG